MYSNELDRINDSIVSTEDRILLWQYRLNLTLSVIGSSIYTSSECLDTLKMLEDELIDLKLQRAKLQD